jgi:hypothetical protein
MNRGTNILVAGLAVQLGALILFMALHVWFTLSLQGLRTDLDPTYADIYRSRKFKLLLPGKLVPLPCSVLASTETNKRPQSCSQQ